jgi:predicted GH43/DUF377 family glycosyl hydrolase
VRCSLEGTDIALTVSSADGIRKGQIDPQPTLVPEPETYPEESWGIEDPCITWFPELDSGVLAYTAYSPSGPWVGSVALTLKNEHCIPQVVALFVKESTIQ